MAEILRVMFKVLLENREGLAARRVIEETEAGLTLTPFEKSFYPKNPETRRFDKIARFSTIAPVKAGWLQKVKGIWSVTDEGHGRGRYGQGPGKKRISLLDLGKLFDLWVESYSKIPEKYRGLLPLRSVYFLESKI